MLYSIRFLRINIINNEKTIAFLLVNFKNYKFSIITYLTIFNAIPVGKIGNFKAFLLRK